MCVCVFFFSAGSCQIRLVAGYGFCLGPKDVLLGSWWRKVSEVLVPCQMAAMLVRLRLGAPHIRSAAAV